MNAIESFAALLSLASIAVPAIVVMALVLRGTGGIMLTPLEGVVVAVAISLAAVARGLMGVFTLDDTLLGPLVWAVPIVIGIRFGARVAVASAAASWLLFGVLALGNRGLDGLESSTAGMAPLGVASVAAVLAGLYAALGMRTARSLGILPVALFLAPALAHTSEAWADPHALVGVVACASWVLIGDVLVGRLCAGNSFTGASAHEQ